MRGFFASADLSHAFQFENSEEGCTNVTNIITGAMEIYIPGKLVAKKTEDKIWFDDHCKCVATKKRRLFRKLKKENFKENNEKFTKQERNYTTMLTR